MGIVLRVNVSMLACAGNTHEVVDAGNSMCSHTLFADENSPARMHRCHISTTAYGSHNRECRSAGDGSHMGES
jgi:hypothetical protein